MRRLMRAAMFGLAAVLAIGIAGLTYGMGVPVSGSAPAHGKGDQMIAKREDSGYELVAVDDDDDDGDDGSGDSPSRGSGDSRSRTGGASRDGTNSRHTPVSRDRDRSRGDKTRDQTRDGRGLHRDGKLGQTNDRSRNDTR